MKKYISTLLFLSILLTSLFSLSSCFLHDYQLSDEWMSDEETHWRVCTNMFCDKISEQASHTYDVGEIIVKPTQETDGVMVRTCTVCDSKKEQTVLFTGLDWTEWNSAFSKQTLNNFTYKETAVVEYLGIQIQTVAVYKYTEDQVFVSLTAAGSTASDTLGGYEAEVTKNAMINSIQEMLQYNEFEYDRETKSYKLTGTMEIENVGYADSATLWFKDGLPEKLVYTCQIYSNGVLMDCTSTITFSHFGTTVIN